MPLLIVIGILVIYGIAKMNESCGRATYRNSAEVHQMFEETLRANSKSEIKQVMKKYKGRR